MSETRDGKAKLTEAHLPLAQLENLRRLGTVEHNGMVGWGPGTGINRACLRALADKGLAVEGPYNTTEPKVRFARISDAGRSLLRSLQSEETSNG